jgi:iron complex outermembrane receptor protein
MVKQFAARRADIRHARSGLGIWDRPIILTAALSGIAFALWSAPSNAAESQRDLTDLSLEQLMNVKVTSVSKKPQTVSASAAAVHVITSKDIRRSSATSIPELLRNVPGLNVARIDSSKWAISARGFNGRFSNKLLVLMDGRTLYNPHFSGVFWDVQDTFIDDIERIEVIRGPGGTVWGANAVNGVINIITKSAKKTNGALVTGIFGSEEHGNFAGRFGQAINDHSDIRVFVKHTKRDSSPLPTGPDGSDDWDIQRGGVRYDNKLRSGGDLMVQSEVYTGNAGQLVAFPSLTTPFTTTFSDDAEVNGQFVLGRWSSPVNDNSQISIQTYLDRTVRREAHANLEVLTFDIEAQKRQRFAKIHDVIAGFGYRFNRDDIEASANVSITPSSDTYHVFSAFVQDEISMTDDIKLTVGSKFEHNSFTGFEFQPSVRALWQVTPKNSLWTAASRAVRSPSRGEAGSTTNLAVIPGAPPIQTRSFGTSSYTSEDLIALEAGYKTQAAPRVNLDIAAFYNIYDNLRTTEPGTPFVEATPAPFHLVLPLTLANNMSGDAYGVEIGADWRAKRWLRLRAAYTYFQLDLHLDTGTGLAANEAEEDRDPRHQLGLSAQVNIGQNIEFDATLRAVDQLIERNVNGYATVDLRLGWRPRENVELSIVGQNLAQRRHLEFVPEALATQPTEVERAVYGRITVRF